MTVLSEQLYAAEQAHRAASALEDAVRLQVENTFAFWAQGVYTDHTVRFKLEDIIKSAYKASSVMATSSAQRAVGDVNWTPKGVSNNEYLKRLVTDVRRNLRVYKKSKRTDADKRRAILFIQHGAGVAAQRGYTDGLLSAFSEKEKVLELQKMWRANFVNNNPCPLCRSLHGTVVGLHDEFDVPTGKNVFINLQGPPRHPRCKCYLVILIRDLENATQEVDDPATKPAPSIDTETIQKMPAGFFLKIIRALQAALKVIRGKK